jgi:hypothetical protein
MGLLEETVDEISALEGFQSRCLGFFKASLFQRFIALKTPRLFRDAGRSVKSEFMRRPSVHGR